MKYFLTKINFKRKQFETTKSAKFKGVLSLISNEHGIVMDWKIEFSEVMLDQYSTSSWFEKKTSIFKHREAIFSKLNLTQKVRPAQNKNDLIDLSVEQLHVLNNYLNDRNCFSSTIKMIVGIIKGNNPGGEAKNPSSAEMIIDSEDTPLKNFVILLDDLMIKNNNNYDSMEVWASEIDLTQFTKLNETLRRAFEFMQKSKSRTDFQIYLKNIKEYYQKYNDFASMGEKMAKDARSKYNINVENRYSGVQLPFDLNFSGQYQKCHIFEYYYLKNLIIDSLFNEDMYLAKKYSEMISDPDNFIPLPEEIHRHFDKNWFTYKTDGNIYAITETGYEYIKKYVNDKYKKIPEWFMTPKRIKYFNFRNQNIMF